LKASSPTFFEQAVIDLLVAMGYGGSLAEAASLTRRGSDEGIDGIIKEDKLGLDTIYVQAKRWEGQVGRPIVQGFSGSLDGVKARKGVMLTTSRYSGEAREYVAKIEKKIVLIDGEELSKLMIDYNIGVAESQHYIIKKINEDYFGEE
jgi:restriction system protein